MNFYRFICFVALGILFNDVCGQLLDTYRGRVTFQRGLVGIPRESLIDNYFLPRARASLQLTPRRSTARRRSANRLLHWFLGNCSGRACGGPGGEWCGDNRMCVYLPGSPLGRCCRKPDTKNYSPQ